MSELFFNIVEITVYVCFTIVSILLVSYSIFYFGKKKIEKRKKEKEKKEALKNITNWILSICKENKKIMTAMWSLLYEHNRDWFKSDEQRVICFFTVERSIRLSIEESVFFQSMRKVIFMCIGFFADELQKVYSAEEEMQKELKEKQIQNQKLSDSEFFEKLKFIDSKISRKAKDTEIPMDLQKLGFLDTDHIKEYKSIFLLFNPEKETERKNPDNSKDWEAKDED